MPRTTAADVSGIIEIDLDLGEATLTPDVLLAPFIATANMVVTRLLSGALYYTPTGTYLIGMINADLEIVERWLSAHFYAVRDMRRAEEQVATVREKVMFKVGLDLRNTMYGQMALFLDLSGLLADHNNNLDKTRVKVGAFWLGTDQSFGLTPPAGRETP